MRIRVASVIALSYQCGARDAGTVHVSGNQLAVIESDTLVHKNGFNPMDEKDTNVMGTTTMVTNADAEKKDSLEYPADCHLEIDLVRGSNVYRFRKVQYAVLAFQKEIGEHEIKWSATEQDDNEVVAIDCSRNDEIVARFGVLKNKWNGESGEHGLKDFSIGSICTAIVDRALKAYTEGGPDLNEQEPIFSFPLSEYIPFAAGNHYVLTKGPVTVFVNFADRNVDFEYDGEDNRENDDEFNIQVARKKEVKRGVHTDPGRAVVDIEFAMDKLIGIVEEKRNENAASEVIDDNEQENVPDQENGEENVPDQENEEENVANEDEDDDPPPSYESVMSLHKREWIAIELEKIVNPKLKHPKSCHFEIDMLIGNQVNRFQFWQYSVSEFKDVKSRHQVAWKQTIPGADQRDDIVVVECDAATFGYVRFAVSRDCWEGSQNEFGLAYLDGSAVCGAIKNRKLKSPVKGQSNLNQLRPAFKLSLEESLEIPFSEPPNLVLRSGPITVKVNWISKTAVFVAEQDTEEESWMGGSNNAGIHVTVKGIPDPGRAYIEIKKRMNELVNIVEYGPPPPYSDDDENGSFQNNEDENGSFQNNDDENGSPQNNDDENGSFQNNEEEEPNSHPDKQTQIEELLKAATGGQIA